ncbi:MAG: phosphotransferase [Phycisphaerales bacterium]|nr:phosphotransferase [Phycisphaerales bacterium]
MPDGQSLANSLAPLLQATCRHRLGNINWFRATWQHSGAGTGFSTWTFPDGREIPCVVKLPVGHREYHWTKRLGLVDPRDWDSPESLALPTPRVLAAGYDLGDYDLAWVIIEKLRNPPIASEMNEGVMWELFETAAEFQSAAILEESVIDASKEHTTHDWAGLIEKGLVSVRKHEIDHEARWVGLLERTQQDLDGLVARWRGRPMNTWCHHDLHARNVMRRLGGESGSRGRCVLIDLAMVGPGCWIEDALYLERLFWGQEDGLFGMDPLGTLASTRQAIGLPVGDDDLALADVRRVLMAASSPAFLRTEGDPSYLNGAIEVLDRLLPSVIG